MNKILLVSFLLIISGCASAPMALTGIGVASLAVQETTGKGLADHAVSNITAQDCRMMRALNQQPICQDRSSVPSSVTVTNTRPSSVTEIESRYR
jgi:hypothetical protein